MCYLELFFFGKVAQSGKRGQAGGLRWPETLRLQPQVYIFCTSPQGLVVARFLESPSCKVVKLFTYLQRQEVEATWDFEATDPWSDKSGSSGGRVALLPRSTWELIRWRAENFQCKLSAGDWELLFLEKGLLKQNMKSPLDQVERRWCCWYYQLYTFYLSPFLHLHFCEITINNTHVYILHQVTGSPFCCSDW